jgi:predicted MPP superfamily phosphohydrolase
MPDDLPDDPETPTAVNILHISDLHYRKRAFSDQMVILEAFKRDLEVICDGPLKPDIILFTGDLVQSADDQDTYLYLYDDLIADLLKITRCNDSRLYMCPGNHDASRDAIHKNWDTQLGLGKRLIDRESLNDSYIDGSLSTIIAEKFKRYRELEEIISPADAIYRDDITTVFAVSGLPLSIVCVNTAWLTGAGIDRLRRDERTLLVPETSLIKAFKSISPNQTSILATHHPINWLSEFSESDAASLIDGNVTLDLFGHMHEVRPSTVAEFRGRRVVHQSGALYIGRKRYNGYALIRLDLVSGHSAVHLRSYFDRRKEFDAGIDITRTGIYYSSPDAEAFWYSRNRQVDRAALRLWLINELQPAAERYWNEGIIDRPICEVFVPPPMYTRALIEDLSTLSVPDVKEEAITVDNIIAQNTNFIIHGRQEYGKTTLIRQIALELIRKATRSDFLTVPLLIDFADIHPGQNRVIRLLNNGLPTTSEGAPIRQILAEGYATILIDDVVTTDTSRLRALSEFITNYPKNRYIYTTITD